jgi:hypothetical protein
MQKQNQSRPLAFGLTILSALGRLVPHAPNVTPLGGSCLFAGSRVSGFWAYLLPLIVMVATDPIVGSAGGAWGGYSWTSPVVYGSFLLNVWIGRQMLRSVTPMRVAGAAFLCSLQFFVLTVFASWAIGVARHSVFTHPGFSGLIATYVEALPFWGRTLAGDLLFSGALFGMYELLNRNRARASEPAAA